MANLNMSVVFLGTSSGGGPSESRNCSSLVCDMLADQSLWMVDCAEGTARQFALQPKYAVPHVKVQKISKIFITHMHADHVMGIVPLLRNLLFPPPVGNATTTFQKRSIELYGPAGLRSFVRQIMKMTLTRTSDNYVVHELLREDDPITPCEPGPTDNALAMNVADLNVMHCSERAGSNIRASEDGLWRAVAQGRGRMSNIVVDAGPILHRDPCIGYVFSETQYPQRKIVILGDTYDSTAMIPLCLNPSPSLLVHEATDSHISQHADPSGKLSRRTPMEVEEKARSRGHSVPEMAGEFAKKIGAKSLVLNHIGGRFPAPRHPKDFTRQNIIRDIERNASLAWGTGKHVTAAYDYYRAEVPFDDLPAAIAGSSSMAVAGPSSSSSPSEQIQGSIEDMVVEGDHVVGNGEQQAAPASGGNGGQVYHRPWRGGGSTSGENGRDYGQGHGRKRRR